MFEDLRSTSTRGTSLKYSWYFPRLWPDQMAYCNAIQACRRHGHWDVSLSILASCEEQRLVPDAPVLNAAIGACGYGREWEHAIALLSDAKFCN